MNTWQLSILFTLLIFTNLLVASPATRLNLVSNLEEHQEYFTGGWVSNEKQMKIEMLIYRHDFHMNDLGRTVNYWTGYFYTPDDGCIYLLKGADASSTTLPIFSAEQSDNFRDKRNSRYCYKKAGKEKYGQFSLPWGLVAYPIDENHMSFTSKGPISKTISMSLWNVDSKEEHAAIKFKRAKLSNEFLTSLESFIDKHMPKQDRDQDWRTQSIFPSPLAARRFDSPSYNIGEYEKKFAKENQFKENRYQDDINSLVYSELTLAELKLGGHRCEAFDSKNAHLLGPNIENSKKHKQFYFNVKNIGLRRMSREKWYETDWVSSLNNADEETSVFMCNNLPLETTEYDIKACPFCFYEAGGYLNSIYYGSLRVNYTIEGSYMRYHREHGEKKRDAYSTVMQKLFIKGRRLTLLEEVVGFYMAKYKSSPKQCFKSGAFTSTLTVPYNGYTLTDGYGYEITRVEPGSTTTIYKLNKDFEDACDELCNRHGLILIDAHAGGLFSDRYIAKDKRRVLDIYSDIERLISEYDCDSEIRKTFEKNLLKLYRERKSL